MMTRRGALAVVMAVAAVAMAVGPAAVLAGCDGFIKSGDTNTFNKVGDSYCFNTSDVPTTMNSFEISVVSNRTELEDLCVYSSTDCTGRTKSVVMQCGFRVGASFIVASTCHNSPLHNCADAWYIGFGPKAGINANDDDQHMKPFDFDWKIDYVHTNIC
uniref:Lipoprotein n=1 Tax=Bicosoecida sp. CB-2014 TaxID=1486930 RepID=A0A7S1GCZ1_9STRA|mmetsp:Transcript_4333/g.15953  ORF Transcript_4333/g.15953 Transcript_4333/m.15953 type:complete len:159 (+) Transcript_4333:102-578(+)